MDTRFTFKEGDEFDPTAMPTQPEGIAESDIPFQHTNPKHMATKAHVFQYP